MARSKKTQRKRKPTMKRHAKAGKSKAVLRANQYFLKTLAQKMNHPGAGAKECDAL